MTVDVLWNRIATVQASNQLDEFSKDQLVDLYSQSIVNLQATTVNEAETEVYREALMIAPAEAERLAGENALERQTDPTADLDVSTAVPLTELVRLLEDQVAYQTAAEASLALLEARLQSEEARPAEARQQMVAARSEAEELADDVADRPAEDLSPQLFEAQRWAAQTRLESLLSRITLLDQELLSYGARSDLLNAQRDAAALALRKANARIDLLRSAVSQRRQLEADRALGEAQAALDGTLATEPLVREFAQTNLALVEVLREQVAESESIAARERNRPRVMEIDSAFRNARRRLDLEGAAAPMGAGILEERRQYPSSRWYADERRAISRSITAVTSRLLEAQEERQLVDDVARYVDSRIAGTRDRVLTSEVTETLTNLTQTRRLLLDRAIEIDIASQRSLYALDDAMTRLADRTQLYDEYLTEHLIWVRSTRPVDYRALTRLSRELMTYFAPSRWGSIAGSAARRLIESPVFGLVLLMGVVMLFYRDRLRHALLECGTDVGHLQRDTIARTLEAFGYTALLAAPVPIMLAALGGGLATASAADDFVNGVGFALLGTAAWLWFIGTIRVLLCPAGVGERHFGWDGPALAGIVRQLGWFIAVAPVAYFVVLTAPNLEDQATTTAPALAILAFAVLMLSITALAVGLIHSRVGLLQKLRINAGKGRRWRSLGVDLLVLVPVVLLVLALFGYTYTVQELTPRLFLSIGLLTAVSLIGSLVRRWLLVTARRLAYEEAMSAHSPDKTSMDPQSLEGVIRAEIDFVALGTDSRKLLNAALLVAAVLVLLGVWGPILPALGILQEFGLWNGRAVVNGVDQLVPVTLADLLLASIVAVGGYVVAARLPSLLDIILLKQGSVSAGGRYTATTLTRYLVTMVSILIVLRLLGVTASQLGWAAAALGVGIGFGLQEIVANFICGLILLFERPIRVGDTITVGPASGTVTKIRIRATTIRDWEHKELVVPNKDLITGQLLNWSLSDAVTRLLITVGVAYGTDVDHAMRLMREAAEENALVLDDPTPTVHFDQFGESSLILVLRAWVGQVSERLITITELHKAIDKKFRSAGIVIAFPQRDVHVFTRDSSSEAARNLGHREVPGA